MSTTRRFYLYLITLAALGVFASGVGQLISLILDITINAQSVQVGGRPFSLQQLSLGLAMMVIGGPLWYFFWRSIQRRVIENVEETGSALRKLYLNLVLTVSSLTTVAGAVESLTWLLSGALGADFAAGPLSAFIVAGVIWIYHWRVSEREGHPSPIARTLRRWYIYILSGFGLIWFAEALIEFISAGVLALPLWSGTLTQTGFWSNATQMAVSRTIFGGLVWYFHWFRMARNDVDSTLRQVYFYLLTVTGGAIAALVAATISAQRIITWALGGVTGSVSDYFRFIGWAIPTIVIATAMWGYHQRLVKEESAQFTERHQSAERVHLYLMSLIGLGTMAAGLIVLFGILLDLATGVTGRPITEGTGWWQSLLGLCLAMLAVGTPLWLYYWGKVLKRVEGGGVDEWRARSRRIFLYGVVIIAIGALIAVLVNIVYQVLNGLLQGHTDTILRESRWSLQVLIVAAPVLWYHWRIIRVDQKRGGEAIAAQKAVTLLTFDRTGTLASRIEGKLGYRIHLLHRVGTGEDPALSDEELAQIAAEIESAKVSRVMVMGTAGKFIVAPYQEK